MMNSKAFDDAMANAGDIDTRLAKACWEVWQKADSDQTGKLDRKEAQQVFEQLLEAGDGGEIDVGAIFDEADTNDDNAVTFGEFVCMLQTVSTEKNIPLGELLLRAHLLNPKLDKELSMPTLHVKRHLETEMEEMEACKELVPSILLFIVFLSSFILHETPSLVHNQHFAIHFDINDNANFAFGGAVPFDNGRMGHKGLQDVNTFADFWSWMNMGFSPLIFHTSWDQNEFLGNIGTRKCSNPEALVTDFAFENNATDQPVPAYCDQIASLPQNEAEAGMYLFYNRLLGGLRLQQERGEAQECPVSEALRRVYGKPCYIPNPVDLEPEIPESFGRDDSKINRPGGESQFFLVPGSLGEVRKKFKEMEDNKWAGPPTQSIEIAFPTYNANWGTVTMAYVHFFVNRGGHFWKQIGTGTVWLDIFHAGILTYIVDGIWVLIILKTFFGELKDVISSCMSLGCSKGLKEYVGFWNLVDWISVMASFTIFFFLFIYHMQASSLAADIEAYDYTVPGGYGDVAEGSSFILSGDVGMQSKAAALMTKIEVLVKHARVTRIIFAFNSYVVGLKLFKAFAAQARLALVTMTIMKAALDIIHFGLVFFSTIAIFATSAMALFGNELQMFSTYTRAFGATMRCLLGDFDWTELDEVGHFLAACWFWSFQIVVVNIMFQMLLAMIMDTYSTVKAETENAETLWGQGYEIYRRWKGKKQGKRLGLEQVLKIMEQHEANAKKQGDEHHEAHLYREITAEDFMAAIPGIKINQANRLIGNTHNMIQEENHVETTLDHIVDSQNSTESMTKAIYKGLQIVIDNAASGKQVASAPEERKPPSPKSPSPPPPSTSPLPPPSSSSSSRAPPPLPPPPGRASSIQFSDGNGKRMPSKEALEERFTALEGRLGGIEAKMAKKLDRLEHILMALAQRHPSEYHLEECFNHMEIKFEKVEERLNTIEAPLSKMHNHPPWQAFNNGITTPPDPEPAIISALQEKYKMISKGTFQDKYLEARTPGSQWKASNPKNVGNDFQSKYSEARPETK